MELNQSWIETNLKYVTEDRQIRIRRFHRWQDQWRALAGELLVRYVLGNFYQIPHYVVQFHRDSYGKPALQGGEGEIEFNVSHSGQWAVAAFHEFPLGIDIEQIKKVDMDMARRMFAEEEYASLQALADDEQRQHFYHIWTAKESYMKALGKGLTIPLDSFSVQSEKGGGMKLTRGDQLHRWNFNQYHLDPNYSLTVCAQSKEFPQEINILQTMNLTQSLQPITAF